MTTSSSTGAQRTTAARRPRLDGQVLVPRDPGYDDARSVWNGMIDHRPAMIVQCGTAADVVSAIDTARERGLEVGVRCGGHNIAGLAVPDGGLMIDLTRLNRVTVDPVSLRALVQGGVKLNRPRRRRPWPS